MQIPMVSSLSGSNTAMQRLYQSLSSGKRINSAKDDPTGLAIANKLKADITANNVTSQNARDTQNMLNIKEGSLGTATDSLQRIGELSVKASNGLYSDSERQSIQAEISQLTQSIGFSTQKPSGLEGYDVSSGNFDASAVDDALSGVLSARGSIGAQSNGLSRLAASSANTAEHLTAAQSRIEDTDYAQGITDLKKEQTLQDVGIMMQKKLIDNADGVVLQLFGN